MKQWASRDKKSKKAGSHRRNVEKGKKEGEESGDNLEDEGGHDVEAEEGEEPKKMKANKMMRGKKTRKITKKRQKEMRRGGQTIHMTMRMTRVVKDNMTRTTRPRKVIDHLLGHSRETAIQVKVALKGVQNQR